MDEPEGSNPTGNQTLAEYVSFKSIIEILPHSDFFNAHYTKIAEYSFLLGWREMNILLNLSSNLAQKM